MTAIKKFPLDELKNAPDPLSLNKAEHQEAVQILADKLLAHDPNDFALRYLEESLIGERDSWPIGAHVAVKLARSKHYINHIEEGHVTVVFAVYKEHTRILSPETHPHGEDFLRRKMAQMDWLLAERGERFTWDMIIVDDGCPKKSGELARAIIEEEGRSEQIKVMHLQEAIDANHPITAPMKQTSESQKGGAVALGLWEAAQTPRTNHSIIYTDADLSTHLGQCGLLIKALEDPDIYCAIGSRRQPRSVVIKKGARNDRGKLFIYLWKHMVPLLREIIDTQCGFKGFHGPSMSRLVEDMTEKRFAFDIELLIKSELHHPGAIIKVPVAWIDSDAASTTTDLHPYLPMLKSIANFYHRYLPENEMGDSFSSFIADLTEEDWEQLLEHIPEEITDREPIEFKGYHGVTVDGLQAAIR